MIWLSVRARSQGLCKNNAPPDPDLDLIADVFLQANDIFQPHKSVRSSLHRVAIAPGPKTRMPARSVRSLCKRPPVAPKCTTQTITRRSPVLFPNLPESLKSLS